MSPLTFFYPGDIYLEKSLILPFFHIPSSIPHWIVPTPSPLLNCSHSFSPVILFPYISCRLMSIIWSSCPLPPASVYAVVAHQQPFMLGSRCVHCNAAQRCPYAFSMLQSRDQGSESSSIALVNRAHQTYILSVWDLHKTQICGNSERW